MTGGGSGGHITPLLPLAHELKRKSPDCQVVYIGYKGDKFDTLRAEAHDFDFMAFLQAGKFRRYHGESLLSHLLDFKTLYLNARDFFRVMGSIGKAYRLLGKFKPDVVFSKGGFVVVPVGIAARLRGIPIITHDSDAVPGLANRIVGKWAAVHATGMPAEHYGYPEGTIVEVGIPIDERIKQVDASLQRAYKQELDLPKESQVLLIAGGGHGSRTLNDLMLSIAPSLLESNLSIHIVHVCGAQHESDLKREYKKILEPSELKRLKLFGFTAEFYKYVSAADLIISRAGATALAEFATAGKACIIMPSPFLAAGHQLRNSEELAKKDAIVPLKNDAQPDELLVVIKELLGDDHRRFELAKNLRSTVKTDAAVKLSELILKTARGS